MYCLFYTLPSLLVSRGCTTLLHILYLLKKYRAKMPSYFIFIVFQVVLLVCCFVFVYSVKFIFLYLLCISCFTFSMSIFVVLFVLHSMKNNDFSFIFLPFLHVHFSFFQQNDVIFPFLFPSLPVPLLPSPSRPSPTNSPSSPSFTNSPSSPSFTNSPTSLPSLPPSLPHQPLLHRLPPSPSAPPSPTLLLVHPANDSVNCLLWYASPASSLLQALGNWHLQNRCQSGLDFPASRRGSRPPHRPQPQPGRPRGDFGSRGRRMEGGGGN